ncbi:MAG: choice-of-anchor D domain-containing protein [Terriglobales bacterium]
MRGYCFCISLLILTASALMAQNPQLAKPRQQGNPAIEGPASAVDFNKVNVCSKGQTTPKPCSRTKKLTYTVQATTAFGKTHVVTQGTPNLDFNLSGTNCRGLLSEGRSCTVSVTFAPIAPGVRVGAVELTDSAGNVLITTLLDGEGEGPLPAFYPSPLVNVPVTGIEDFLGAVAVDAAGDIFAPAYGGIAEFARGKAPVVFGSIGFAGGIALDGAGNIYASDFSLGMVDKIDPHTNETTTLGEGLFHPVGVAVDKWGNVYVSDSGNNRVVKVSGVTGGQTTLLQGYTDGEPNVTPEGITVDGAGDVFVADEINELVWEFPKGDARYRRSVCVGLAPTGVAVDAAGDVFLADFDADQIDECPAGGGRESTPVYSIEAPVALALDGSGNLFIAQQTGTVMELKVSQPPTLDFGEVAVGTTTNPQFVTIQNAGTQPLNAIAPALSVSSGFIQNGYTYTSPGCTDDFSLVPGGACNVGISFVPQSVGTVKGTATFTDNGLNKIPSASQSVPLTGTGTQ